MFNLRSVFLFPTKRLTILVVVHGSTGKTLAEWSKAPLVREKINGNKKDHRFASRPGQS